MIAFTGALPRPHADGAWRSPARSRPTRLAFGPYPGRRVPRAVPERRCRTSRADGFARRDRDLLFKADIDPKRVAAIIIEPVQGEGGFNVAPPALLHGAAQDLRRARHRADRRRGADRLRPHRQAVRRCSTTASSPTSSPWPRACAAACRCPAVVGRAARSWTRPAAGGLGGTYAGNPLAVASAHAVLDVIADEKLCERAAALGEKPGRPAEEAQGIQLRRIADVRSAGLDGRGGDCATPPRARRTPRPCRRVVQAKALAQGLVLLSCGVYGNVMRFLYPLTIPDAQFDRALAICRGSVLGGMNSASCHPPGPEAPRPAARRRPASTASGSRPTTVPPSP